MDKGLGMNFWLMKTEPDVFSIDDLKNRGIEGEYWDGVRNYQARNYMRDQMKLGDLVLIYHSNANPSGVAGIGKISGECIDDLSSLDKKSKYFDPKATKENPRWVKIKIEFVNKFKNFVPLEILKNDKALENMPLVKKGSRLSIMPVSEFEFHNISKLGSHGR